jgi:hypothetical protein
MKINTNSRDRSVAHRISVNRAVARVTSDYAAFCDDDMWW